MSTNTITQGTTMKIMDTKEGDIVICNGEIGLIRCAAELYDDNEYSVLIQYGYEEDESGLPGDRQEDFAVVSHTIDVEFIGRSQVFLEYSNNIELVMNNLEKIFEDVRNVALNAQKYEYLI